MQDNTNLAILLCNSAEAYLLVGESGPAYADYVAAQRLAQDLVGVAALELTQALQRLGVLVDHASSGAQA
jgi:hypothetical protein